MARSPRERFGANAVQVVSTVVTGLWVVALVSGQDWWLAAMLFGYLVVVPAVSRLYGHDGAEEWGRGEDDREPTGPTDATASDDDALETLRDRYARGELTDEQFERKLDRLLESETLEDVEDRAEREREREHS